MQALSLRNNVYHQRKYICPWCLYKLVGYSSYHLSKQHQRQKSHKNRRHYHALYRATHQSFSTVSSGLSISSGLPSSPLISPNTGYARLTNRALIAVHGPDAPHFLQGICTANIATSDIPTSTSPNFGKLRSTAGFPAAFLNAQGRLLHDVFIYPATHASAYSSTISEATSTKYGKDNVPAFLIEVDAGFKSELAKWLRKYRLRAKVDVREMDQHEWSVWSAWGSAERWTKYGGDEGSGSLQDRASDGIGELGGPDVRAPGMGRRIVLPPSLTQNTNSSSRIGEYLAQASLREDAQSPAKTSLQPEETDLAAYTLRRYLRGVPEGQQELPYAASLPQESNLDFTGAIDFRKGCYVGQELTIRTHHTGVVRKRVLPVTLSAEIGPEQPSREMKLAYEPSTGNLSSLVQSGSDIRPRGKTRGRSAGRFLAGLGNIGLALCRVEMMTDLVLTGEGEGRREVGEFVVSMIRREGEDREELSDESQEEHLSIKAFVPDWIRNQIKVKAPNVRV